MYQSNIQIDDTALKMDAQGVRPQVDISAVQANAGDDRISLAGFFLIPPGSPQKVKNDLGADSVRLTLIGFRKSRQQAALA